MKSIPALACLALLIVGCSGSRSGGTPAAPNEVVLDRYKGKGLLIVAAPSEDHRSYKKYVDDEARVVKLCDDIGLTPVEIIGAKEGTVLHGPKLDATSLSRLKDQYQLDATKMTLLITGGDGAEVEKRTGDVDVKGLLEML